MRPSSKFAVIAILMILLAPLANAVDDTAVDQILIKNVHVWDGTSDGVTKKINVLVENNLIKKLRASDTDTNSNVKVIDGDGHILIPGLIDMHTHLMYRYGVTVMRNDFDAQASGAAAMESLQLYMQMGYTTVRDVGGNSLGLAKATVDGRLSGPRIYSSGGAISPISGHNDLAMFSEQPASDVFTKRVDANVIT